MSFLFGIEVLLRNQKLIKELKKKKVSLVCHPASVDQNLNHSIDLLMKKIKLSSAFGPQHGVKGEKQDNMIESTDELHPEYQIPIFSLYGTVRRPTQEMMKTFDVILFDLQDLGCRIYTFVTTLLYMMDECARYNKTMIILDRPNPIGRNIEGLRLRPGQESFVGAAPFPMRHGLTTGELALYFQDFFKLKLDLRVIKMKGYKPNQGWPVHLTWVNPSPNAANLNMARVYPGSVLLEGTNLSEGRGTTRPLELVGAPDVDMKKILNRMRSLGSKWMEGAPLRECYFEPTFHKHQGKTCHGFQIHTDHKIYQHKKFKPYRLFALFFKALRHEYPDYPIYRNFHYEYVTDRLAFDVINGGPELRDWIETPTASTKDLDRKLKADELSWEKESKKYFLY